MNIKCFKSSLHIVALFFFIGWLLANYVLYKTRFQNIIEMNGIRFSLEIKRFTRKIHSFKTVVKYYSFKELYNIFVFYRQIGKNGVTRKIIIP